jgi:hypothetical protein
MPPGCSMVRKVEHVGAPLLTGVSLLMTACTSFATVRSAEVLPGPSVAILASATTPTGDIPGWFWAYECPESCDRRFVGGDAGVTWGWPRGGGAGAFALGVGLGGLFPYLDGYIQLGGGRQPFGIGARLGPPLTSWREHQLYGRYDLRLSQSARLLLNPAVFLHEGNSPNGASRGSFLAFVQGVGVLLEGERVSWTPAVALVAGRAERNSYGQEYGPVRSVFGVASLGVTFHRPRATP